MILASKSLCLATQNVREVLHPPRRLQREPIVKPEHPWEARGVYFQGSVLKEGRSFRMWYSAIGARRREEQFCGYAESTDGQHWVKPVRQDLPCRQWAATNIVYGQAFNISAPNVHGYRTPREGYRLFMAFDSRIEQHEFQFVTKKGGLSEGEKRRLMRHPAWTPSFDWSKYYPNENQTYRAVYLADSVDGIHWEPSDARLAIPGQSDGDHTVVWDPVSRHYRMYLRDNRVDENGRRIRQVVTATSPDTIEWTTPELCLESDAIDDPRLNQIHGMTVTWHDGVFIGLIQMMEIIEEAPSWHPLVPFERARFHVQLAVSTDGRVFHRVGERGVFFGPGEEGAFDSGMVRCGGQWVFDDDRMLMYYDGRPYAHAPIDAQGRMTGEGCEPTVGIGVATSPRNRFAGLAPADRRHPGYVVVPLPRHARSLTLNADIPDGASITASVRYPDGCRVLTHTDEQCIALRGNGLAIPLQWHGQEGLPEGLGPLHLRIALQGPATVYALNESP